MTREVEAFDLNVVQGAIPSDLNGLYVRNGSNPQSGESLMWFFGDGMAHGVSLGGGSAAWYRNRYVNTTLYQQNLGFGDSVPGGAANQSNVSFFHHAGRLMSSGEVGAPYELDPADLSTIGVHTFDSALTSAFTAHPKIDPDTGHLHSFGYGFVAPYLTYHVTDTTGAMIHSEPVEVPRSTMMHDFMITDRDVIFMDLPVVFDLDAASRWMADPTVAATPFQWQPEVGARLGVMPLGGPASAITWYDIDPCYVFHSVNAYRDGDTIVMDVCRQESMFAADMVGLGGGLTLRRWTLNTVTGSFDDTVVEQDNPGELPTRDPRRVGRRHRYGYLVETHELDDGTPAFGGLIKHDFDRDTRDVWTPSDGEQASEWLFVPGTGDTSDTADDAGYAMSYVYNAAGDASQLVIIDATDVASGPVARIELPQRVPYGFHAAWVPSA